MHFKYDQHLELHNGIHSAIRGKILEATFAPVWVEPLESSVMGSGFGEEGSTTAQTFAISGISGSKVKRARLVLPKGAKSMQLSVVLNQYHGLLDECNSFNARVCGAIAKRINAAAVGGLVHFDDSLRNLIISSFPAYQKLRMNKAHLDAKPIPQVGDPGVTEKDREMIGRVGWAKSGVEKVMHAEISNNIAPQNADMFIANYLEACLLETAVYGESFHAMVHLSAIADVIACSWVNAGGVPAHRHYMDGAFLANSQLDLSKWKALACLSPIIRICLAYAQSSDPYNADIRGWDGGNGFNFRGVDVLDAIHANLVVPNATLIQIERMQVCAAALACFVPNYYQIVAPRTGAVSAVFNNPVLDRLTNLQEYMAQCQELCMRGTALQRNAIMANASGPILQSFHEAVQNLDNRAEAMLQQDGSLRFKINHTLGVCIGSVFSQRIIYLAYHFGRSNNFALPVYQNILRNGWPALANFQIRGRAIARGDVCPKLSRLCMLVSGLNMIWAALLVGKSMSLLELAGNEGVALVSLSLYLVHVNVLALLNQFAEDNRATFIPAGVAGFNDLDQAATTALIDALRAHAAALDWSGICAKAVQVARTYAQQMQAGALPAIADEQAFMARQYDVGATNYMQRKLGAEMRVYVNSPPGRNDSLRSAAGVVILQGGRNTLTFSQMYSALANRALSQDRVFEIIHYALYSLDRQDVPGGGAPGIGTNTAAAIGGDESGDDGEAIMHIGAGGMGDSIAASTPAPSAGDEAASSCDGGIEADPPQEQQSSEQSHDSATLTLGSILLDSSEKQLQQQQQQEAGELLHTAQEMEDSPSDPSSAKGGAATKQGAGAGLSAKSAKGSFKRVTARLL